MLNSGAVLQQRTLPYLKMPSGQCQHLKLIGPILNVGVRKEPTKLI